MAFPPRFINLFLVLYVTAAVLHTTNFLLVSPICVIFEILLNRLVPPQSLWSLLWSSPNDTEIKNQRRTSAHALRIFQPSNRDIEWVSSDFSLEQGLGHVQPILMKEDTFLSKAFSNSMQPSKIIPFFYRASGNFDHNDITITTLITSNRFQVFSRLVERYQGPISVTIHVQNTTTHLRDMLNSLHALYSSSYNMATYVDVHLVIDSFDRQFNTWRNIARLFARTDFVMMLDIDFSICTDFRTAMRRSKYVMDKLQEGYAAFVIPAFEYVNHSDGADQAAFPRDKQTLLTLVNTKRVEMFHASWAPGHNSTDYKEYYTAAPGAIYKVTQYQSAYEPYVIFKKDGPPWCDERFVGYGGNKAACLFEMYLSGVSYYVLADHFIIHQNHLYEEAARKNERKYNRRIYSDFKEEICLRYLKHYNAKNLLNTTRGLNLRKECNNVKAVAKIAAEHMFTPLTWTD